MTDFPSRYDQPLPAEQRQGCGCHKEYIRTRSGIFEIAEVVLDLVVLICASVRPAFVAHFGGGYVQFVAILAMLWTALLFFFHFTGCIEKLPGPWPLIKFASYVAVGVLYFIASAVCSAKAKADDAIAAATFFAWVTLIVYLVDTFFKFREWRSDKSRRTDHPQNVDPDTPQY